MGPLPPFAYYTLVPLVGFAMLNWFVRRRAFLLELQVTHPELWERLNPIRIPLAGFSDHSLEKFVARGHHREFKSEELVKLGDKLRSAQRFQVLAVALLVGVFLWFGIGQSIVEIGG